MWTQDGWTDTLDGTREYAARIALSSGVRTIDRSEFARIEAEHRAAAEFKKKNPIAEE